MLWDDYNREFKHVQRKFRDVEDEVFLRAMVERLPESEHIKAINEAHDMLAKAKDKMKDERPEYASAIRKARGAKEIADADAQGIKADYDSINSLINIAQDNADRAPSENERKAFYDRVTALSKERDALKAKFDQANQTKDEAARAVTKAEAELRTS